MSAMRGAQSTPYIGLGAERRQAMRQLSVDANSTFPAAFSSVQNLALKLPKLIASGSQPIQFNQFSGSSSSSTELSDLMRFYNTTDDPEVVDHWMGLYEAQKAIRSNPTQKGATPVHQNGHVINKGAKANGVPMKFSYKNEVHTSNYLGDSVENLQPNNSRCSLTTITTRDSLTPEAAEENGASNKYSMNRSMDILPTKDMYPRLLEKCCSVDWGGKTARPPAKLARSKEMPNILDLDLEDSD